MFADSVKIFVKAGKGGAGSPHFRREKYVPRGGPDGGDGGRGGSITVEADLGLNTLYRFLHHRHHMAEDGSFGLGQQKHGKSGEGIVLKVPVGTVVHDEATGQIVADLDEVGATTIVARGGRGGLGNVHFTTSTHQSPHFAERGEPGEERWIVLELKLIADIGIIGLPNAGKSTLLSRISAARPKIADYPFTTLSPNLGVVSIDDDRTFVAADIPGLIEGAHTGAGLGHEFLRHVERTAVFVHLLDGSSGTAEEVMINFDIINKELELYQENLSKRPMIVALNKMDLTEASELWPDIRRICEKRNIPILALSGVSGLGIDGLLEAVWKELAIVLAFRATQPPVPKLIESPIIDEILIEPSDDGFIVRSRRAERAVAMTDPTKDDGIARLQELLRRFGVTTALDRAGVEEGDAVHIGATTLIWGE